MSIIIYAIYNSISAIIGFPWRFIMFPIIKWYRNIGVKHLKKTVRNEGIRLEIQQSSSGTPYLQLSWILNNGSETNIEVKRLYGTIYSGDMRVSNFDEHSPIVKNMLIGNKEQYLTIQEKKVLKGRTTRIEGNFYPSMEFWLRNINTIPILSLSGVIEISGYGSIIPILLIADNLKLEGFIEETKTYYKLLKLKLSSVLDGDVK